MNYEIKIIYEYIMSTKMVQTVEMHGNDIKIGTVDNQEITKQLWQKYSSDEKGNEIYVFHSPDKIKCEIGSKLFQKDICGTLKFMKVSGKKITTIDYEDIPDVLEYMMQKLDIDTQSNGSMIDYEMEEYYEHFEKGYDSY